MPSRREPGRPSIDRRHASRLQLGSVGVSPSRNLCSISSSVSATDFNQLHTEGFRLLHQVGRNLLDAYSAPMVSSCHRIAFISIRSMTPLKFASAPIGICSATGRAPSRLRMVRAHTRSPRRSCPSCSRSRCGEPCTCRPAARRSPTAAARPNRIEQSHRAVENAQRPLDLGGEVHVARSIDNVNADIFPGAGGGSGSNRNAALLLLLHVIHGRRAFMHFADAVRDARYKTGCARSLSSCQRRCAP